jgi:glycosyltransferase involved in cell wall biosynthesis
MSSQPAISVALPVYNGANFLREAVESVLAQDFGDFELVVSDNASTDDIPTILADYARRDSRLRVSRSDTLLPQADNVNRAMSLCNTEWVKLFCHDDLMAPNCLRTIVDAIRAFATPRTVLIGNAEEHLFANGFRYAGETEGNARNSAGPALLEDALNRGAALSLPSLTTATVGKAAWQKAGGFDARFVHFDVFLWARLLLDGDYLFIPQVLTANRIHGAQVAIHALLRTMRSAADQQLFWKEFLKEARGRIHVGANGSTKAHLKGVTTAATAIAIQLLKRQPRCALRLLLQSPASWWPVLPPFVARSFLREQRRIRPILAHVPIGMIYPD